MITTKSVLKVTDNSGVKFVKCIKVVRTKSSYGKKQISGVGDIILTSVKILHPKMKIKKGQLFKALIVRTKHQIKRSVLNLRFEENTVILLKKNLDLVGNRIFGPIAHEAFECNFVKFATLHLRKI